MRAFTGWFGKPAALGAALVLAAGCSSSGSVGGVAGNGGSGSFKDVLKSIHADAQTSGYIEYGDTALLTKANGGGGVASGPFSELLGLGSGPYTNVVQVLPPLTGFDPLTANSAISAGNPPNAVSVLYGSFDPAAVGAKLAAWGYHKQDRGDGLTAWIFADDHQMVQDKIDPSTGIGPGMNGWLNVVWVSKTSIAYGWATSDLADALPARSKSLDDDPTISALADCLGSPLAAIMATNQKEIQNSAVSAIAFGVTGTGASDMRMEMCVAAPDDTGARRLADGFTKAVESGEDNQNYQPWSASLSDPQTTVLGGTAHVAHLSAKLVGQRADLMVSLVERNDYLPLLGLPEPSRLGAGSATPSASSS